MKDSFGLLGTLFLLWLGWALFHTEGKPAEADGRVPPRPEYTPRPDPAVTRSAKKPAVRQVSYAPPSRRARFCSQYDPVARPWEAVDVLLCASKVTGTPFEVLFAVWRNETGETHGAGTASGRCPVLEQLEIRCKVGGNCSHEPALREMAEMFAWDLESMTCSCGTSTLSENTGNFGGCCGPFQFSFGEIIEYVRKYRMDPMTFADGAVIAGWELRKHHDEALRTGRARTEHEAWRWAIRRYLGGADGPCKYDDDGNLKGSCKYYAKAVAQWKKAYAWYQADSVHLTVLRKEVTKLATPSSKRHQKRRQAERTYASSR